MINNEQIQALKEQAECVCGILENIAGYEPDDIDGDDVELRFETEDGFDTGCTVSIVEQCQSAADIIRSLLAERDADKALIDEQAKRIAELEARTVTVKLPEPFYPDGDIDCPLVVELDDVKSACAAAGITLDVGE